MIHPRPFDGMTLVAVAFLFFMGFNILRDRQEVQTPWVQKSASSSFVDSAILETDKASINSTSDVILDEQPHGNIPNQETIAHAVLDVETIIPPYESYTLTQGPHGYSYGHMAIDLTAGNGAVVRSPINGVVTALFIDNLGNTTLIIENDRYQVTMLHGIYTVAVGDALEIGQPVGQESNQGNTVDGFGVSCRGRDCGYHTHLNIYDKILGANVNPLQLFGQ
jgi:murein DD-endopeptidase MepM/ murein hydrolase activator NlpD